MSLLSDICGETPENFVKENILSNPDFVFINDPSYPARTLYDVEGNKVTVNSFIECENYFSGGWSYNPIQFQENLSQLILISFVALFLFIKLINNLRKKISA